jgi:small-conductance mechanosensitive channel
MKIIFGILSLLIGIWLFYTWMYVLYMQSGEWYGGINVVMSSVFGWLFTIWWVALLGIWFGE